MNDTQLRLAVLLCSNTIMAVDRGELSPLDLDKKIKYLEARNRELEYLHILDMSEIVNLRRQIELLTGD